MSKLLRFFLAFLFLFLSVSACSRGALTPEGRSINYISRQLVRHFDDVEQRFYQEAHKLRVRLNPCHCSDELKYDVHLGGNWRRVSITGHPQALKDFELKAKEAANDIFEAKFLILKTPFLTPQSQKIYLLEVFSETQTR